MKKILVINTKFPWPAYGAGELDRVAGIERLIKRGFEIKMLVKYTKGQGLDLILKKEKELGIDIVPVLYKNSDSDFFVNKVKRYVKAFFKNPLLLDGASLEYDDPEIKRELNKILDSWKPDVVMVDMTFCWPLYGIIRKRGIRIVTRSHNIESEHIVDEHSNKLIGYLSYLPKVISEKKIIKLSDVVLAITPVDKKKYIRMGKGDIEVLPLRGLPSLVGKSKKVEDIEVLNIFFAGANYGVRHNRDALSFLLKKVFPLMSIDLSKRYKINIFGKKFPEELKKYLSNNIVYRGLVDGWEEEMMKMDVAITPSVGGGGMQQKIFEPIARGIPSIVSPRALAGYDFSDNIHILVAKTEQEFVDSMQKMLDFDIRCNLSRNSIKKSKELFDENEYDKIIDNAIKL